jgi:hypothetical protein
MFLVVTIIANTLQFGSASAYVKCQGWTLHKRGTTNKLQYRKLEQVFDQCTPNGCAALLAKHLHAMAKEIYSVLNDRLLQHVYEPGPVIHFLKEESFLAKLHQYSQDYQIGLIVCNTFFMVVIPDHHDDPEYWMKKIFASCRTRKDYITFCHNCFVIFPNDASDPVLAKCLITDYLDCMRDKVHCRVSSKIHQKTYGEQVEASLWKSRGTQSDAMPLPDKELLLCHARVHDLHSTTLSQEDRWAFISSTRRKGKKRNSMAISGGAGMCSTIALPVLN